MRWAIKKCFLILLVVCDISALAQVGQINITRVQQMPNLPSPYIMRNWKAVAIQYDQFIFSTTATGQHLPLLNLVPTGINYPEVSPILLQTYVGTNSVNQAEAINIIPALVGASLMNIDKTNQSGVNWAVKAKDFFNKANGEDVYLNGYSTTSGGDWWYDLMPNVFFYQLYSQYPSQTDFHEQFTTIADRWLEAVHTMGGSTTPWTVPQMNYRAWDLMTMTGNTNEVKEPEAAGGIGWLLYHAYLETGETKYLEGAQMSIEFLSNWSANPSYELQLPYGAFIAAKMNAELGTTYDVTKMVNWCFDRGSLRGWGAIVGTWNGSDVDGLIGEANDGGNDYAFVMNGYQQAAALVPLIKYDKRFARGIAKWTLNLANASRLFYSQYLTATSQDDFAWSSMYDPQSVIAYEALKEKNNFDNNTPLYGTGDAKRNSWAQTNLSLYSSSSVGYLAAVVEPTDVDGILLVDVNKTDFFTVGPYPSYVLYNPHAIDKLVTLTLPAGSHDIYDAISETVMATNASSSVQVTVKADEAVLLVYIPSGSVLSPTDGKLYVGNQVIDYHYGYDFSGSLRIKSLAVTDTLVEFNQPVPVYAIVENATATVTYTWLVNGVLTDTFTDNRYTWTVPEIAGRTVLQLQIESNGKSAIDSIVFNVVENIPTAPVIQSMSSDEPWYAPGSQVIVTCLATDDDELPAELNYNWVVSAGTIVSQNGAILTWQPPAVEGIYEATCEVTDLSTLTTTGKKLILVKQLATGITPAFAYYPLDGNAEDYSGNDRHAQMVGVDAVADARGEPASAYRFNTGSDIIFLDNSTALNFQDQVTLAFWVKLDALTQESFILSHGSWEERWKVSVTPGGMLRWTVKTNAGTVDLDSSFPLTLNQFYHFAVVYSGYSMELYGDGELDTFLPHSGLINTTSKALTFGRKDKTVTSYFLNGTLDEVRVYNATIAPDEIATWKSAWNIVTGVEDSEVNMGVYPNPVQRDFYLTGIPLEAIKSVTIFDIAGRPVNFAVSSSGEELHILIESQTSGLLIVRVQTISGVYYNKVICK